MPPTLLTSLRLGWARLQGRGADSPLSAAPANPTPPVTCAEALLHRARTQSQFGDWEGLATITQEHIQHHADRAKLDLIAAAGLQQLGRAEEAKMLAHPPGAGLGLQPPPGAAETPRNSRRLVVTSGQLSEAGCPVSCR